MRVWIEQERFPGTINHRLVDCQVINHMFLETFLGSKILSPLGGWWVSTALAFHRPGSPTASGVPGVSPGIPLESTVVGQETPGTHKAVETLGLTLGLHPTHLHSGSLTHRLCLECRWVRGVTPGVQQNSACQVHSDLRSFLAAFQNSVRTPTLPPHCPHKNLFVWRAMCHLNPFGS